MEQWFAASWKEIGAVGLTSVFMYAVLIVYTRVSGLRSFSKMSGFDFAITVAFGSILAGVVLTEDPSLLLGAFTLGIFFVLQKVLALLRSRFDAVEHMIGNSPLMLVYEGEFFTQNMARAQVTRQDIMAKLREANVIAMEQVRAVVLESTGDVSVLHSSDEQDQLELILLEGVDWGEASKPDRATE